MTETANLQPKVVLTVGNTMMGDDAAGPYLAELLGKMPAAGWIVIDGGSTPENVSHEIDALAPSEVLIVDAADMGLLPGEMRIVEPELMADLFIMSTHNLPLSFMIERLREDIGKVTFIGIQPDVVAFYFPMTDSVRKAVETLHGDLVAGHGLGHYPVLEAEADFA